MLPCFTKLLLIGQSAATSLTTPSAPPAPAQTGFAAAQTGFAATPTPPPIPADPGFAVSLIDTIIKGGVIMYPMILLSIFVFALIVERALYLRSLRKHAGAFVETFFSHWEKDDIEGARNAAEAHEGPIARMLRAGLGMLDNSKENIQGALHQAALAEMPSLNRFLSTIAVIGTIMPIMGLLGTVSGMINTFEIITIKGTGDPKALAGGISEALITTQTGLIFALPIMLLHTFLANRVDYFVNMMETSSARFLVRIKSDTDRGGNE